MKASEARKIASKIDEEVSKKDYDKVLQEITKAVNAGNFSVMVSYNLLYSTVSRLRNDGYTLTHLQTGINEYSYDICW